MSRRASYLIGSGCARCDNCLSTTRTTTVSLRAGPHGRAATTAVSTIPCGAGGDDCRTHRLASRGAVAATHRVAAGKDERVSAVASRRSGRRWPRRALGVTAWMGGGGLGAGSATTRTQPLNATINRSQRAQRGPRQLRRAAPKHDQGDNGLAARGASRMGGDYRGEYLVARVVTTAARIASRRVAQSPPRDASQQGRLSVFPRSRARGRGDDGLAAGVGRYRVDGRRGPRRGRCYGADAITVRGAGMRERLRHWRRGRQQCG